MVSWLFRQAKTIPITSKRRDPRCFADAFDTISAELDEGWLVCIFPEGKITNHGEMNEFKQGIEWIVERNPVPVVPMALNGLWGSFFSRVDGEAMRRPFRRGLWSPVWLTVGEPVPAEQVLAASLQQDVRELWAQRPQA